MKVSFRQATVERTGHIPALNQLTCDLEFGAKGAIALLGANGAGKSTFLNAILGLCPLKSGEIEIDGTRLQEIRTHELRRRIGMIFQNADDQLFSQTVYEDVAFGPTHLQISDEEVAERVHHAMDVMGITALAKRDIIRLSGGEKRRVSLAGILAMQPDLLLLDEPTAMLDPRGCRELSECLNKFPAAKLIATHDLVFAEKLCPQCVILKNGSVFAEGKTEELLKDEAMLMECGLA